MWSQILQRLRRCQVNPCRSSAVRTNLPAELLAAEHADRRVAIGDCTLCYDCRRRSQTKSTRIPGKRSHGYLAQPRSDFGPFQCCIRIRSSRTGTRNKHRTLRLSQASVFPVDTAARAPLAVLSKSTPSVTPCGRQVSNYVFQAVVPKRGRHICRRGCRRGELTMWTSSGRRKDDCRKRHVGRAFRSRNTRRRELARRVAALRRGCEERE